MMHYNRISVIVATYNQEETIGRTLDSILRQKCHCPFEIVIGEDCSTDRTGAICQEYAKRYPQQIRLFSNLHNKGVVNNYMDCLLACQGELIADCAGDDFWVDDEKLEKELRIMESDEAITLVHTAWRPYNEKTQTATDSPPQPFPAPVTDGKTMLEAIITQTDMPVIHLCTALYRADTVVKAYHAHQALFRDPDIVCEDLQIAFFLAQNGKIAYLPDVTLHYSQGGETVSDPSDGRKAFRFFLLATRLSHRLSETANIHTKATEAFFSRRTFELLMHALRAHDPALRAEAIKSQKEWEAPETLLIRTAKAVTAYEPLWKIALLVRRILVRLKSSRH